MGRKLSDFWLYDFMMIFIDYIELIIWEWEHVAIRIKMN